MSAESPRRAVRCVPAVVPPQAVNDRSIIDSVAGFINDVALTNSPQGDPKDTILWARFETDADVSDLSYGEDWDLEGGCAPPLLLILGYGTGVQVWAIPANGEAIEVLSWRHGSVKCLRVLPTPVCDDVEFADVPSDQYAHKRPIIALCDSSSGTMGSGTSYRSVNFISLRDGDQVKSITFKNPILDILANRSTVVVTFQERIAVFDARTFEDRLTVTTCHPSPGLNPNPVSLGTRWMAYAERKLLPSKRSSGGCDGDGVSSYTATVLNAAKSLGKGLRELGETMAAGLTGAAGHGQGLSPSSSSGNVGPLNEGRQPGVVTILDIKHTIKDISPTTGAPISSTGVDPIVAHFVAHSDAVVALAFDPSGMLLLTTDKRGHDFHVFRIHPHPGGPSLAAVHHLYVLHRGDTTAKVQDIVFSLDSRWVAVSSLRGTTHVFPVTPYGGPAGIRTHGSPHVVNRLSRFHRSAGLSVEGRSSSPVSYSECSSNHQSSAYTNPRTPPFPHPTVILPLTQLRQPATLNSQGSSAQAPYVKGRQRHSSLSDEATKPLRVCATFARPRAWLLEPPGAARETPALRMQRRAVDSLFIMAGHGALIQYDLEPKHTSNIAREKVCDETPIELEVEAKAQWNLLRSDGSNEIQPPLSTDNWLVRDRLQDERIDPDDILERDDRDDRWLAQVEILTHAGPHRRLWMGPQFMFKTYNTPSGSPLSHIDAESVEVGIMTGAGNRPARSNPMNMPLTAAGRALVPVLIESGSCSSYEQSPRLMDQFRNEEMDVDFSLGPRESQLREDLADAMRESPASVQVRDSTSFIPRLPNAPTSSTSSSSTSPRSVVVSIAKVVNPLGTVTTILTSGDSDSEAQTAAAAAERQSDHYIHENCDEALFRPVVTVLSTNIEVEKTQQQDNIRIEKSMRPTPISTELIVPVMEEKKIKKEMPIAKPRAAIKVEVLEVDEGEPEVTVLQQPIKDKVAEKKPEKEDTFEDLILSVSKKSKKMHRNDKEEIAKEKTPPPVIAQEKKSSSKSTINVLDFPPLDITPSSSKELKIDKRIEPIKVEKDKKTSIKELTNEDFKDLENMKPIKKSLLGAEKPKIKRIIKSEKTEEKAKMTSSLSSKVVVEPEFIVVDDNDVSKGESVETSFTVQLKRKPTTQVTDVKLDLKSDEFKVTKKDYEIIQDSLLKESILTTASSSKKSSLIVNSGESMNKNSKKSSAENSPTFNKKQQKPQLKKVEPPAIKTDVKEGLSGMVNNFFDITTTKLDLEFPEDATLFTEPLAPLEPFEANFEQLSYRNSSEEPLSLMTFESPVTDKVEDNVKKSTNGNNKVPYTKSNLIFALCTSLHEAEDDKEDYQSETASTNEKDSTHYGQSGGGDNPDNDFKSLELEIDENYLSLDQPGGGCSNIESSSTDEDSSSTDNIKKSDATQKSPEDDDDELQPLIKCNTPIKGISTTTSATSTSTTTINLAKAMMIDQTLPDNNQSDSSKQQQQKKKSRKKKR